jgi:hypothetical protein
MAGVFWDDLEVELTELARGEAEKRAFDEFETQGFVAEAADIIFTFKCAVNVENVENGKIISHENLKGWTHRLEHNFEPDWQNMGIDRDGIQTASDTYLEQPWLQSRKLDWVILDLLTYAEYQATLDYLRSRLWPMSKYVSHKVGDTKAIFWSNFWGFIKFLFKFAIWLAVCVAGWLFSPYVSLAWAVLTAFYYWRKYSAISKINQKLVSILGTYSAFNSISQSWDVVWQELAKTREAGVVWDGVVYRLVEQRKSQS